MIFNESAKLLFDISIVDNISSDQPLIKWIIN